MATAKDLHSKFYLITNSYIFSGKSPNLVDLSIVFFELWGKPYGGIEYPLAGKGKPFLDGVLVHPSLDGGRGKKVPLVNSAS